MLNATDYGDRTGAVSRGSLTTLRPVTVLPIAEEPILDFAVNAVKPLFSLERVLLHLLHLLLQLFGTVFSGSKRLHPEVHALFEQRAHNLLEQPRPLAEAVR